MGRFFLIPFTLPMFLWGHLYVGLAFITFVAKDLSYDKDSFALTAEWRPWFAKLWKYSTTIGFGIIYHPNGRQGAIRWHENSHVRQNQDLSVAALIAGVIAGAAAGDPWWWLALWLAGPIWMVPNFFTALLRYAHVERKEGVGWFEHWVLEVMYLGSEHERSAYAQDDHKPDHT